MGKKFLVPTEKCDREKRGNDELQAPRCFCLGAILNFPRKPPKVPLDGAMLATFFAPVALNFERMRFFISAGFFWST